jgi:hypothetical protein
MNDKTLDLDTVGAELSGKNPRVILTTALSQFDNIALAFSGAEDVALIDMAVQIRPDIRVFCLDTGRLHPQTYRLIEQVRERYSICVEVLFPDPAGIEQFFLFMRDLNTDTKIIVYRNEFPDLVRKMMNVDNDFRYTKKFKILNTMLQKRYIPYRQQSLWDMLRQWQKPCAFPGSKDHCLHYKSGFLFIS